MDKNRWREKHEFEAKRKGPQYLQDAQERDYLEVPKVLYIDDKVANIPVDMQRQVTTMQAAQQDTLHNDEVVHVSTLMQREVPIIPDTGVWCLNETADEDRLEHADKKRRLPMPVEAVFESRANESDFDWFDDLILPYLEGKTLFVNIASSDEAEDGSEKEQEMTRSLVQGGESMLVVETDARGPEHKIVQVAHAENDLVHVREQLGVLVRRKRCAETKAEIAARRLDRV